MFVTGVWEEAGENSLIVIWKDKREVKFKIVLSFPELRTIPLERKNNKEAIKNTLKTRTQHVRKKN